MTKCEVLKQALTLYMMEAREGSKKNPGMCWCIKVIANQYKTREEQRERGHIPYNSIKAQIPEFNPFYLKAHKYQHFAINQNIEVGLEFWWDVELTEPRIKAFKELIEIYKDSDKEFIW